MSELVGMKQALERRRVRVWFGPHAIVDVVRPVDLATRVESGLRRRFAGLLVTNEAVDR